MSTATFIGVDTVNKGKWRTGTAKRGRSGYYFVYRDPDNATNTLASYPSYITSVTRAPGGTFNYAGNPDWLDLPPGDLRTPACTTVSKATTPMKYTVAVTDSNPHVVSTYSVVSESSNDNFILAVADASSNVLWSRTILQARDVGVWYSWVFTGSIVVQLDPVGASTNSSGVFFDEVPSGVGLSGGLGLPSIS